MIVETPRLILRPWRDDDLDRYTELSRDPEVMANYPALLSRDECAAGIARQRAHFARHGFGIWALELRTTGRFIGYTGIQHVPFDAPFTPAVEIGWRIARDTWGHGYATEAARASVAYGFDTLGLAEVVAFTIPSNTRSLAVMERLGMERDPADDFDHPRLPDGAVSIAGHPVRRHVLYRLRRP
ncbi:MAG TPA: GNAT family N-acetyltransferase [Kofleriaceae bacterium]|nr:GNAT family N-acetyltransferase [Kofleriaceae bacterium]